MKYFLILPIFFQFSNCFFFGASGCNCPPTPQCPPSPCSNYARSAKTVRFSNHQARVPQVYAVPDELDLRAAAFGVPIQPQPQKDLLFDILHNLGEKYGPNHDQPVLMTDSSTDSNYFPEDNDDDLTEMNGGLKRGKEIRRSPTVHVHGDIETTTIGSDGGFDDEKCSSGVLRKLMIENMSDNSADSKKNINLAAEAKFGGNVDVICSRGHFSYIFTSNLFCEASKGLTTCIAFRQSDNNGGNRRLLHRI